jgi:hypothetical protein
MKSADQIPYYAPDGSSMGFRTLEAARQLIAGGHVKPAYGRKGHLKAIWLLQKDGGNPVATHPKVGTRYSFREALDSGLHCWTLRGVDGRASTLKLTSSSPSPRGDRRKVSVAAEMAIATCLLEQ